MGRNGAYAEEIVQAYLEKEYKKPFKSQFNIYLGEGKKKKKNFDLVSEDSQIVVMVKSSKLNNDKKAKNGYSSTTKPRLISDYWFLEKVQAKKKILALTDRNLYDQFRQDIEGLSDVEVRYFPLKPISQQDMMRNLYRKYPDDKERIIHEYAEAERRGIVKRIRNTLGLTGEAYASRLWSDGMSKGLLKK